MDPVSHLALGRAIAVLRERPPASADTGRSSSLEGLRDRRVMAAFLLGSLAPDIDALLMPSGWDRYLLAHQQLTHSIAGTLACAVLTALVLAAIRRTWRDFLHLTRCAWIGTALAHVGLDLVSGGTVRPVWPLLDMRWTLPLVGMADPILATPLWLFFLASFVWRRLAARLARFALGAALALLAVKSVSLALAGGIVARHTPAIADAVIEAEWGSFVRWAAFDRSGDVVRRWKVDVANRSLALALERSGPRESPEARASLALETVRNFHAISDLGFPEIRRDGATTTVLWSDIRFCFRSGCALWFGGTFDAALRPVEQFVMVGSFRQTRAP
jgi:membrane-bound metal-dependent hydrolase YbcI (DUF457 family)